MRQGPSSQAHLPGRGSAKGRPAHNRSRGQSHSHVNTALQKESKVGTQSENQSPHKGLRGLARHLPALMSHPLPSLTAPASLVSLRLLKHTQDVLTPGPLHGLYPLLGGCFPKMSNTVLKCLLLRNTDGKLQPPPISLFLASFFSLARTVFYPITY